MQVASTTDSTIVNLPFDASGNLLASRLKPNASGFGQVTGWQIGANPAGVASLHVLKYTRK